MAGERKIREESLNIQNITAEPNQVCIHFKIKEVSYKLDAPSTKSG